MSFGWSAGDIITTVNLLIEIGQALRSANGSPKDHARASTFVAPVKIGLEHLLEYAKEEEGDISTLDPVKTSAFRPTVEALAPLIKQFIGKVLQYSGLQDEDRRKRDWFRRQFDKLKWHFVEQDDLLQLRETIISHFAFLSAVYPKMIINILELQESKSAERDADILAVANTTQKNVNDIYVLLTHLWSLQQKSSSNLLTIGPDAGVQVSNEPPQRFGSALTTPEVASALLLVEPYIQPTMTDDFAAEASRMKVDGLLIRKLGIWLSSDPSSFSSSRLWLFGPRAMTLSAIVFNTARKRHRAAVAYPCRHVDHAGNEMTEEKILVGLVYSFIYQLLQQLPKKSESNLDVWVSGKDLEGLDGSFDSVGQAIDLIESLLENVQKCVCIIDGFQYLGHTQDEMVSGHLLSLLEMFQGKGDANGRLLLTSSGPTQFLANLEESLLDRLNVSKYVDSGRFILSVELMGVEW